MLVKLLVALRLPLFVDEAFYWQEGQHLAAAYSDLPGLTAWLTRLGVALGGDSTLSNSTLALRLPFLLLAAFVPWLVVRIARRESGERDGWIAGSLALLLPLSGSLGLLALPDAAMAVATLLCVDAGARLLRRVDAATALELAGGLALGALSHYRFIAVIGVGFLALLLLPDGRRALRDVRVWTAIAFGAAAWTPLVAWNFDNADAGLRFQLVERHPWAFHVDGVLFLVIQALLVTPVLFAAMGFAGWRALSAPRPQSRYFGWLGLLVVAGFFVLGFFADTERVSFHWPLPGYLALLPLLPALIERWPKPWRVALWCTAGAGLAVVLGYYVAVSVPDVRARAAAEKWYPSNFAGWDALADAVREERAAAPADTLLVADNFKVGAELGFALGDPDIPVLDHPLNHFHGRAPQLRLWGLQTAGREDWGGRPVLLVVGASEVRYRELLARYHALCEMVGPLPPPRVLNVDHGRQRFLLFRLSATGDEATGTGGNVCVAPAMAWITTPTPGQTATGTIEVAGWAFKDGVGLSRVELMVDGRVVTELQYGLEDPGVAGYWRISSDPQHPKVGFRGTYDIAALPPGRHWIGLRLHGRDGSVEDWSEQPIVVEP
ncbi:glycosyltransferase family 39 protein [Lysobacter sp. TLK-CK17T]|uniref:Glycosyltransferase family 39 protein n=2 Tax=Marilutibacter chinensis TaxID=2912247 RepID=A0ABS9HX69_9GAMM|nr:glycosyltransferase family 39 protein [Lysobacter chinensis]MCF7223476.1 glycosyltransferase family 39 protein [Lysobacter chinensis]